ncbi:MAG: molybdopterin-binding protein [Bacteroidales bacterium]|nr:molybdopterin-binding protein [Bacteroidales bacterium]
MNSSSMIKVVSVNISEKKGISKHPVDRIYLTRNGIENDAHRDTGHRMVSMLGLESIQKFSKLQQRSFQFGDFAENITTEGMELQKVHPLDLFYNDKIELEVTQIGKKCHGDGCSIFQKVGSCIMPYEGIFARVVREGFLQAGDILYYKPRVHSCLVITLSDRAYQGIYEDLSGKIIVEKINDFFTSKNIFHEINHTLLPDDREMLEKNILNAIDRGTDLLITTGGTGIGPKDITIETVKPLLDKEIPGITEYIRWKYGHQKPQALLTRSLAGVLKKTQIYCIPGSARASREYIDEILPHYFHIMNMLYEIDDH